MAAGSSGAAREAIEAVARRSYGKLVAFVAARTHDVASAEDALSEAFTIALREWPAKGLPANPEAWLLTVARRRGINMHRHQRQGEAIAEELAHILPDSPPNGDIPDERLALLFACAHPAIDAAIRAPLMLQSVLGLDAARIASAFLVSPSAMSQRLVRAKTKIREAGIPFRIPELTELPGRISAVLDAIYAAFTEGWLEAATTDAERRDLATEAIFLARLASELLPGDAEALGLVALLLYSEARHAARRSETGEYVPLEEQDVTRWKHKLIGEAEALLRNASQIGSPGRYQWEAALQSAHIHRRMSGRDNWAEVVQLYDALYALTQSPVVALNRVAAIANVHGPAIAIAMLDELASDVRLQGYQPYWAARADLLCKTGAHEQARHAYDLAIGLERDAAVRAHLQKRQAQCCSD